MDDQESFQTTIDRVVSEVPSVSVSTVFNPPSLTSAADEFPQAKPSINRHDALWATMGALQDDIELAQEVLKNKAFLGPLRAEHVQRIKKAQIEFAQRMSKEETSLGMNHYREIWTNSNSDKLRSRLFDDPYFDLLNDQVKKTEVALEQLAGLLDMETGQNK
ncbi:hypothetical protein B9G98_03713 [Wickerhamiella sorbophila]|uniref:Uncharacterized protein n=1 Tax=Wickerhamiella sorbophila TaxID=45607 RepID=A0A2T0FM73_9ASCO|nr:hypothetical protein B9G98_03713 [Wickerhamiella sorbophila]PRT56093.1 hypothetical protein B9G98_03713 [Wickerhamiella sorbophila]